MPILQENRMNSLFADRIADVPQSFIREILKVTLDPSIISFAGGLPNRDLFPVQGLRQATEKVFASAGKEILQYANSEGYPPLREYIAKRYKNKQGLDINPEHILITTGSQQGIDLLGKVLLNRGDHLVMEEPGYLGAIQAFSLYRPGFLPVSVSEEGMDLPGLQQALETQHPKLMYTVPNFQNPSGISYSEENRQQCAHLLADKKMYIIQDDPYADLCFVDQVKTSFLKLLPEKTVLLGSFSKTIAPSLRIGWLIAPPSLMEKLLVAKQAADLHTNYLSQRIIYQFLCDNDLDEHISTITSAYGAQKEAMTASIKRYFPKEVKCTDPEGGMFVWVTLPKDFSAMTLFEHALAAKVAFVPGTPFYINTNDTNTLRLNFSCMDIPTIEEGIKRLADAVTQLLNVP